MTTAPERIRVAQDADGFWTCRLAISGSQEYIRADLHETHVRLLTVELAEAQGRLMKQRELAEEREIAMRQFYEAALQQAYERAAGVAEGTAPTFDFEYALERCQDIEVGTNSARLDIAAAIRKLPEQSTNETEKSGKELPNVPENENISDGMKATTGPEATPVEWQRRWRYPSNPGEISTWEQCSADEATGYFERLPEFEYRPLYAHPLAPALNSEKIEAAAAHCADVFIVITEAAMRDSKRTGNTFVLDRTRVATMIAAAIRKLGERG